MIFENLQVQTKNYYSKGIMDDATTFGLLGNYERSRVTNGKAEIQSSKK